MRILHPVWRGFWLAVAMMAGLVLMGFTDALGPFRLERRMVAFGGAVVVGSFLGRLPGFLRGRRLDRTSWQRCLKAFLGGASLALGLGIAEDGRMLPALLTGSPSAFAFALSALFTGFLMLHITARIGRIRERRRA